jgi:hypothetical protein
MAQNTTVHVANEIIGLANAIIALVGVFFAGLVGAVVNWVRTKSKIQANSGKISKLEEKLEKLVETHEVDKDEGDKLRGLLKRDLNMATQSWGKKLDEHKAENVHFEVQQAEIVGGQRSEIRVLQDINAHNVEALRELKTEILRRFDEQSKEIVNLREKVILVLTDRRIQ